MQIELIVDQIDTILQNSSNILMVSSFHSNIIESYTHLSPDFDEISTWRWTRDKIQNKFILLPIVHGKSLTRVEILSFIFNSPMCNNMYWLLSSRAEKLQLATELNGRGRRSFFFA